MDLMEIFYRNAGVIVMNLNFKKFFVALKQWCLPSYIPLYI